jgi:hypothetical protein
MRGIVKGSVLDASEALAKRGLQWAGFYGATSRPEVKVLFAKGTDEAALASWFMEPEPYEPQHGFPPGSLLWYGE